MRPMNPIVWALLKMELLMLMRDYRTLILSVFLPLLVMPLMMFSGHILESRRARELDQATFRYAITGPQATDLRSRLAAFQKNTQLIESHVKDPQEALKGGEVDLILEAGSFKETASSKDTGGEEHPVPGAGVYQLLFRANSQKSTKALEKMSVHLKAFRTGERTALLRKAGFSLPAAEVAHVEVKDLATQAQVAGLTLGRVATLLLMLFLMTGGSVVATSTLAGEKERGTLETLLSTAADRSEIILAKLVSIFALALVVTGVQVLNFLLYAVFKLIPTSQNLAAALSPGAVLVLLLLYLPMAALLSAVMLLVCGLAKSHKEAQLYFLPLFLVAMMPALAPFLPGISLRSIIVLVPVSNVAVAAKEILTGRFDWPMIALAFLATTAVAAWVIKLTIRTLSTERLIASGMETEMSALPGPVRFQRQVLKGFALMWGLTLLTAGLLPKGAGLFTQILLNLVLILGGSTFFMIRHFGLDPRQALSLRKPHPAVWPAVLVGVPAALLTVFGLMRLINMFIPVPQEVLENFNQSLLPQGIPPWLSLVFVSVMPAVFEELAFRGVLLYGLEKRFKPIARVLVVSLVFGLFHFALFRLIPTAFLGAMLACVTLLSGSIFPAMLWHGANNACGILLARHQVAMEHLPLSVNLAAAAVLGVVFWVLWRTRRK